jgi:NAD(P)-dependent dehydrogenase (short-subunit alcohol dehydrogenase family)
MDTPGGSLEGKTAIITGSRRGIGKAIALAFAEAGADVAVCDLEVEDGLLGATSEEIQKLGRRSLAIQVDIARKADVDNMVQMVMGKFGGIDILVNNAAILGRAPLLELSEDDWDKAIDINLKGYYLCSQAVGKRMVERKKGSIISIASQLAFRAAANLGAYCISKAGVVMLTRVLARELGSYNIRVNGVAPSVVTTELGRTVWSDPEVLKQRLTTIPMGRLAEASDIVGAILFLASDASSYISGHTILVDGATNA